MTDEAIDLALVQLHERVVASREIFVHPQQRPRLTYIVAAGWAREYLMREDGSERTVRFILQGDSTGTQLSETVAEAGTETTLLIMSYRKYCELCRSNDEWARYHERLLKRLLKEAAQRERELLTMDATQRYEALLERCPTIEDVVPLRDIASYLGISAVHLSRVRARV